MPFDTGGGSGGGGEGGSRSPYAFQFAPTLDTSNVVTATTADIPADDDTLATFTILDAEAITGGVLADEDFVTEWAGGVYMDLQAPTAQTGGNLNGFAQLVLQTTHVFNGKTLIHERAHTERSSGSDVQYSIPLNVFTRRSRVSLGTYRAQDGSDVEITAADLAGEVTMSYKLIARVTRTSGVRRPFRIDAFSYYDQPAHWAYQLAPR